MEARDGSIRPLYPSEIYQRRMIEEHLRQRDVTPEDARNAKHVA